MLPVRSDYLWKQTVLQCDLVKLGVLSALKSEGIGALKLMVYCSDASPVELGFERAITCGR